MDMKRSYQTKAQRKSEEEEKKREKLEKYENAADDYKRGKFANIRKAAMAYDLNYNTLYKVCYSYPWSYKNEFCGGDGYLGKKKLTENLA